MRKSVIFGHGSYLPKKIMYNDDLSKIVDTNDEWISTRTGIKQRHISNESETTSMMAASAAKKAIEKANINASEIDLIIVATTTADNTFPSVAVSVQDQLSIKSAAAFDIQAVCSGFIYGLSIANNFIATGQADNVLVVGAEKMSSILDWTDRNTCVLFGDGAGALVLKASDNTDDDRGIIATSINSDGSLQNILKTDGGISTTATAGKIRMAGREVFKHAVSKMSRTVTDLLKSNSFELNDLDFLVPHQANQRIMESIANKLNIPNEKIISTVSNHANTSAASIPLAIDKAASEGRFSEGDLVALTALGGGLTWGGCILKW